MSLDVVVTYGMQERSGGIWGGFPDCQVPQHMKHQFYSYHLEIGESGGQEKGLKNRRLPHKSGVLAGPGKVLKMFFCFFSWTARL